MKDTRARGIRFEFHVTKTADFAGFKKHLARQSVYIIIISMADIIYNRPNRSALGQNRRTVPRKGSARPDALRPA